MANINDRRLKLFTANANPVLAREVAEHADIPLGEMEVGRFANGEIKVRIRESVRGADVFLVQSTCSPVNENLMELLIAIDAFKRASARRVNVVIPYYGYARQDRKTQGREPVTAKLVANLLTVAGADRVVTMDLHAGQIQGFFDIPVDHLTGIPTLAHYFKELDMDGGVIVSPDVGGVARARKMANILELPLAFIDKRRPADNVAEVMHVVGDVEGHTCIMVDDLIDTAGTLCRGSEALVEQGAESVYACATHAVFSEPAPSRLEKAPIKEVVVTDTIPLSDKNQLDKLVVRSVAPLLGDTIVRINEHLSVSKLFK